MTEQEIRNQLELADRDGGWEEMARWVKQAMTVRLPKDINVERLKRVYRYDSAEVQRALEHNKTLADCKQLLEEQGIKVME